MSEAVIRREGGQAALWGHGPLVSEGEWYTCPLVIDQPVDGRAGTWRAKFQQISLTECF